MIRIKDIAEIAGVSPTTVSNVIHGNTKKVSKETIEKINRVIEENDFIPGNAGRNQSEYGTKIIGVIIRTFSNRICEGFVDPFMGGLIGAIESEIYGAGYYMMIHMSDSAEECIELALKWRIDGLITVGLNSQENLTIKNQIAVPHVTIDAYYEGKERVPNVGLDDYCGGYLMTKYLLGAGHRNIAYVTDSVEGVNKDRIEGFMQAHKEVKNEENGSNVIVLCREPNKRLKEYDERLKNLLENTALFFSSDIYAFEAVQYFKDLGIRVPEDISIAGFDDNYLSKMLRPRLTTVSQDVNKKGSLAVNMLLTLMRGETLRFDSLKLPVEVVKRESVKVIE